MKTLSTAIVTVAFAVGALWFASSRLQAGDEQRASTPVAQIDCAALSRKAKHIPEDPTVEP